ncbi:helix-turn-helix domain-containing protein [Streptomyces sp. NPDC056149]|uniref:helix-turn-helix domain-containing protein n=1 Tax=unclassified Streptomyces TaxID=2593676 RepID=UPI0031589F38
MTEFQEPGYTIIGDHLAQHHELSLGAIGLAVYILSLPEGSQVDIRSLAQRFPEGRERIATGLRELERHGYLKRVTKRLDDGRLVTVTTSYNNPRPTPTRTRRVRLAKPKPEPVPESVPVRPSAPARSEAAAPPKRAAPTPKARPSLPRPRTPRHLATATALLANLRRDDPRLLLPVRDIERLAPGVAAWLEREVPPEAVRKALSADLPAPLRNPAGLLAHRLTALLPPPLPETPPPPEPARPAPVPFHNCEGCERAIRSPGPARCRDCRPEHGEDA